MRDAIAELVRDGDTVAIEGFTHLIGFAAGHEIIRQRRRDLTLCRLTPDLIYDQMIAARRRPQAGLLAGWATPAWAACIAIRRRIEQGRGAPPLELEEYSHFGMVGPLHRRRGEPALLARCARTPRPTCRGPTRSSGRSSRPTPTRSCTPSRRSTRTSRSSTRSAPTPTATPRCGGCSAARRRRRSPPSRVIVVVEELVDEAVIRADPNRTIIPGLIVDAVVVEPFGAHPSYVQGYYDRDNRFYLDWDAISARRGPRSRPGCASGSTASTAAPSTSRSWATSGSRALRPGPAPSGSVDYGSTADRRPRSRKSEMMIVAAARELAGQHVCFVGVGLPNIAVNLAEADGRPGPGARLRGGRVRCPAGAAAAVHRRPDHRHRARPRWSRCSSCSPSTSRAA